MAEKTVQQYHLWPEKKCNLSFCYTKYFGHKPYCDVHSATQYRIRSRVEFKTREGGKAEAIAYLERRIVQCAASEYFAVKALKELREPVKHKVKTQKKGTPDHKYANTNRNKPHTKRPERTGTVTPGAGKRRRAPPTVPAPATDQVH